MKKFILILLIFLTGCTNYELNFIEEYYYGEQILSDNIENELLYSNIMIQITLNSEYNNDWKEKYDLDNMTSDEIDLLIKEQREISKGYYTTLNTNFVNEHLSNNTIAKINFSKYSAIIELEYNSYDSFSSELDCINNILLNDKILTICIYVMG